jgi:formate dehydrogenase subunit gamma
MWRGVRDAGGTSTLPGAEKGVLIQPFTSTARADNAGEAWRRAQPVDRALRRLLFIGCWRSHLYWRKGPLGGHLADTGRVIERFTPLERAAHWSNASAFVVLAVSGLVMAFGKFILLPLIGSTLFGWLTWLLKTAHNLVGPLFAVSLVIVLITFFKDNIANRSDITWLARAGGMFSDHEVPSHRFNAGEKGVYWWGAFFPGLIAVATGLALDGLLPFWGGVRSEMQIAHLVHSTVAILMMCVLIGHIYMGTLGMKDALKAMKTGYVDEAWAREHHELWYDDIRAGKIPAQRSATSAPAPVAQPGAAPDHKETPR